MMEWEKYTVENQYLTITATSAIMLGIGSIFFRSWLAFFVAVLILLLYIINNLYLKKVGVGLHFENEKARRKFFPGEEGEWTLDFHNQGVPIMKAKLTIFFNDSVVPINGAGTMRNSQYEVTIPFSINHQQKTTVTIPFSAEKRGMSRIRKIEMMIPHFFGLGETVLTYNYYSIKEVLVYPRTMEVQNKQLLLSNKQGDTPIAHFLFEDTLAPAGTREYHYSDSFNRIHWKASARNQALQTKIFDKVTEIGWNISVNVGDNHFVSKNLEEILSSTADLAYFFVKQNIPFSVCINIRQVGRTPFYYILPGKGREHLQKVLEMIALVDIEASVYPFEKMLAYYESHLDVQPFLLQAGEFIKEKDAVWNLLAKKGAIIYELVVDEQGASIVKKSVNYKRGMLS